MVIDRKQFPLDLKPKVREQLQLRHANGEIVAFTVTDVSESSLTLDANHPLAGKDLTFDIPFIEVV